MDNVTVTSKHTIQEKVITGEYAMDLQEKRLEIIRAVGRGELSVEEGSQALAELEATPDSGTYATEQVPVGEARDLPNRQESNHPDEDRFKRLKSFWIIPFTIGIIITILGGMWMAAGYNRSGLGWGFWLSWIPFSFGLLIMVLSWMSQKMAWLHVRVHQKPGERPQIIAISFPLPVGLTGLILRIASPYLPEEIRNKSAIDGIETIARSIKTTKEPIQVFVDDEDGEQVEVYIG